MMEKVYFSLGSNLGDRQTNLNEAIRRMEEAFGKACVKRSGIIETKSYGFDGEDFLNCAVMFELDDSPAEVLKKCKRIERKMGRPNAEPEYDAEGKRVYHNRTIDIDILLYGDRNIDTRTLTIPHPRMYERDFVMQPLKEIIYNKTI